MPAPNYFGPDSFTDVANDGELTSAPATVSIAVAPVNDPPLATSRQLLTAEDVPLSLQLGATDADDASLDFSITSPPSHGTLSGSGASYTYIPDANFHGNDELTFVASDGQASSTATVRITVVESNDAPLARNLDYVVAGGGARLDPAPAYRPLIGDTLSYRDEHAWPRRPQWCRAELGFRSRGRVLGRPQLPRRE